MKHVVWLMALLCIAAAPSPDVSTIAPCDEAARLASIIQSEAYSQPGEAQIAIALIVVRESKSRGMTICALSERTNFLSVWHYAQAHPDSWHARQFAQPRAWALLIARAALAATDDRSSSDRLDAVGDEVLRGAAHFNGAPCGRVLWTSGETYFCR